MRTNARSLGVWSVLLLLSASTVTNADGARPLIDAVKNQDKATARALLKERPDVNASEPDGATALHWAVSEKHPAVVRMLIDHGADVRARSKGGFTPILFAARAGDLESTRALLAAGADVNDAAPDGSSVLVVATVRGHAKLAIELLDRGADPNSDVAGFSALHWASGSWETELTGPNGIVAQADDEWSALPGIRTETDKLQLVHALLDRGANPNAELVKLPPRVGYSQLQIEHRMIGVNPHAGATPFLLAAMAGEVSVMRALASGGADPRRTAADKTTPLMVAAGLGRYLAESRVTEERALGTVKLALALGADVNATNDAGNTALHGAASIKSNALVQFLVDNGATIDITNKRGQTPLTIADTIRAGSATISSRTSTGDLLRRLGAAAAR